MKFEKFVLLESWLCESDLSFSEQTAAVAKTLRSSDYNPDGHYRYVVEMHADWFVFAQWNSSEDAEGYFKASYQIGDDKAALLGDPTPVQRIVTWEPTAAQENATQTGDFLTGDFAPLIESSVSDGSKFLESGKARIKVIGTGWGSSGYYSEAMLKRDGAKAFPKGTKMFWNHPTASERRERPERDLDFLAAVFTTDAVYEANGPKGAGLYADIEVKTHFREKVATLANDIGDSIYAEGRREPGEAEGQKGYIVTELKENRFNSVDFVTYPGAGGEIVTLFESANPNPNPTPNSGEDNSMTPEQIEALKAENETLKTQNAALLGEAAKLRAYPAAREAAGAALADFKTMPAITRENIVESCAKSPILAENGALDAEKFAAHVKECGEKAMKYLAEAGLKLDAKTTSGAVRGNGAASVVESAKGIEGGDSARAILGLL